MKYIVFTMLFITNIASSEEIRLCEEKAPFPPHSQKTNLSKIDYDYEKYIYELSYDEIEDITYERYLGAFEYFQNTLPERIKGGYNLFNSAEYAGTYQFYEEAIHSYALRQKGLVEFLQTGTKGKHVNEFCIYLSKLAYHP